MTGFGPARDALYDTMWATFIPDPDERAAWMSAFRPYDYDLAARWHAAFDGDLAAALPWRRAGIFTATVARYLHRHGLDPNTIERDWDAAHAANLPELDGGHRDDDTRICLMLVHPHLTGADRDAITDAGLTLDEVDHLITTGTYDRDTLHLLRALR